MAKKYQVRKIIYDALSEPTYEVWFKDGIFRRWRFAVTFKNKDAAVNYVHQVAEYPYVALTWNFDKEGREYSDWCF